MTATPRLSRLAGRGAVVNLAFGFLTSGLAALQGIIVPRLLGPDDVGLFAVASGGVATGLVLKQIDLPRKVVQERDIDLHTSFRVAFTLELMLAGAFLVLVLVAAPILAAVYDEPKLWIMTSVLGATIFSTAFLDLPAAVPYREMNFLSRNLFTAVAPVVTFAVTVPAAYLGAGIWSLVGGTLAGFVAAALVMIFLSPIRPGLLWDKAIAGRFLQFGWPAWLSGVAGVVAGWGAVFSVSATVGVAAVGYFVLAQAWGQRALQIDHVLGDTVFPALCSMQSSLDRLRRAFIIVTRLSMLWAAPVGVGLSLFAQPAVSLLLGERWQPAVLLMQAEGLGVIVNSIGNSWYLFYGARGNTKPWLVQSLVGVVWTAVFVIPLLIVFELDGAAMAIVVLAVGSYALRQYYTTKMFGRLVLLTVVWRELLVGAIAGAVLLLARAAGWRAEDIPSAGAQLVAFLAVAGAAALLLCRPLLREVRSSLRSPRADAADTSPDDRAVRRTPTPRPMAFPLLASTDAGGAAWVTTRDWPAVGRLDPATDEWRWWPFPSFPHAPSPDGRGGCWMALTRSSALAHVDAGGATRVVAVTRSRELLVSVVVGDAVWFVDAGRRVLARYDDATAEQLDVVLPDGFVRPDFVAVASDGALWVADTRSPCLAVVSDIDGVPSVRALQGPHPTRALLADPAGRGMWLGASDRAELTLVGPDGDVRHRHELPGIPFGLCALADGRIAAAVKDADVLAVVDPTGDGVEAVHLPAGSLPMGCTAVGDRILVTLAGRSEIADLPIAGRSVGVRGKDDESSLGVGNG